jgi:hypothetical protein
VNSDQVFLQRFRYVGTVRNPVVSYPIGNEDEEWRARPAGRSVLSVNGTHPEGIAICVWLLRRAAKVAKANFCDIFLVWQRGLKLAIAIHPG